MPYVDLKVLSQAAKFEEILLCVEDCHPRDAQGNFITAQEKSDVVHDLLAFLTKQILEMNKQKQHEIKGSFSCWRRRQGRTIAGDLLPRNESP